MYIEFNYLPDFVKAKIRSIGCKPNDVEVKIGNPDLSVIDTEIERLRSEIESRSMLQWAIDKNKMLIQYLEKSKNIPNINTIRFCGNEYQQVISFSQNRVSEIRSSSQDTWLNDTPLQNLFAMSFMYVIKEGEFLLQIYSFCNKKYFRLYCHSADFKSFQLESPKELSRDEKIVLTATRCLKGSYAGDNMVRERQAKQICNLSFVDYKKAQESLLEKGFLKKSGKGIGLTTQGKNISTNWDLYHFRDNI